MPTYSTPAPITATIEIEVGDIWITADQRVDTVVEVVPSDASVAADVRAAADTRVELADGRLQVTGPHRRTVVGPSRKSGSVQVTVGVPVGSRVDARTAVGGVHASGSVGDVTATTSVGDIRLQRAASAVLRTGMGAVVVERVEGNTQCRTGSGSVDIASIGGTADVRNSNGDTRLGETGSAATVKCANGHVWVEHAHSDLVASTANGSVRVGRVGGGSVQLRTALGAIDVGVPTGTAARLDLHTSFGTVRNQLETSAPPSIGERTVEIHAETKAGDIQVRRVPADDENGE